MWFFVPVGLCFLITLLITPIVKWFAVRIGAMDKPDERKVHHRWMPRMGGLAIYLSFMAGTMIFSTDLAGTWPILAGGTLIAIIGMWDDLFCLSPKVKFWGQIIAALIPVMNGVVISYITMPDDQIVHFGLWSIPITIFWIVGITNAINFIDGLDGLAAGVSSIALITISTLAFSLGAVDSGIFALLLLGSSLGFLIYNFYPAKIFMGDTGSLFIGYMISILSITGLTKSATVISLIIPIIILAIPIMDTFFAIIRRIHNGKPITAPDKYHLHHSLLRLGFSHRQAVLIIYLLSGLFSLAAIICTKATVWGASLLIFLLLILIELIVEVTGLISVNYRPLLKLFGAKRENIKHDGRP